MNLSFYEDSECESRKDEKKERKKESFVKPKQSKAWRTLFGVRRLDAAFFRFFRTFVLIVLS